jgi:tetratricopeptide (TPR) repeat protein
VTNAPTTRRLLCAAALALALAAGCGAPRRPLPADKPARMFDGLGSHTHPITTRDPMAQRWFDQGLRLAYGFNHTEAQLAFEECTRVDPEAAMCWWGVAYVLGPNYNLPGDPERDREAFAAVERARAALGGESDAELAYVEAITTRYGPTPPKDRRPLDEAWAKAMADVARRFPDDLDAQVLAAEALMDLQPWDLWTIDGAPKGNAVAIVRLLEGVLARDPAHPGANHYYIHAVEASAAPERALGAADRLRAQRLETGHLVHMPSHIYVRTGRWADATAANVDAIAVDEAYIAKWKPDGPYPMMYYPHNVHFRSFSAAMEGRRDDALESAHKVAAGISSEMMHHMPMLEGIAAAPFFQMVRFERWDELLAAPAPAREQRYLTALHHWARGVALATLRRPADAAAEARRLDAILAKTPEGQLATQVNTGKRMLGIASNHLHGEIAAAQGRMDEAVRRMRAAVALEDGATYMEPPDWFTPVRSSLGATLLRADRAREAELVFEEDLKRHPENGWSLRGLAASLERQGKQHEADAVRARQARAWARADVERDATGLHDRGAR